MLYDLFQTAFGDEHAKATMSLPQIAARSVLLFTIAIATVRMGKSRLLGRSSPIDVILGFVLGSVLGRGIAGAMTIPETTVSILALVATHWAMTALTFHSHRWGDILKGHCHSLMEEGAIKQQNLKRSHISEHDLMEALRLRGNMDDMQRVQAAYKERSGEISFVLRDKSPKVIEVQVEPGVQTVRIELSGT